MIVVIFVKVLTHIFESVMITEYEPARNELMSSDNDVYPDGPVQLYVYPGVPPDAVIFIDPFESL